VPGIESASLSANGPLAGSSWRSSFSIEEYTAGPAERLSTNEEAVAGPYFQTVGLRLLEGRLFEPGDHHPDSRATVVNATMARRFFPGQSAVGKRWSYADRIGPDAFTIVGVVEDARYLNVRDAVPFMTYHPAEFDAEVVARDLEIRTAGAPAALVQTVRQVLAEAEPRLPVTEVLPLSDRVARGLSGDRLVAQLTTAFGVLALLLAALGLYGTISYGISRRVSELGLRMALGADRASVLRMIMREALVLVVAGAVVGLPLAFAAARSVAALLYGVQPADTGSYLLAAGLLVAISAVAAYLPAYRASRIEPMLALGRS
jgi:predicted permease